ALERDPAGHVLRAFDATFSSTVSGGLVFSAVGQELDFTYRGDGQMATLSQTGGGRSYTETFAYEPASLNATGWSDTLGRSVTDTLDARGNVIATTDGTATTSASYDIVDRLISSRDALGNETLYGYTHAGCGCTQENLVTSIHTPDLPFGVAWEL